MKKYLLLFISIHINGMNQHIQTFYYQMMQIAQQIPKEPGQQQYPQIVVDLFNGYESFLTTNDIKVDNTIWWPQRTEISYFEGSKKKEFSDNFSERIKERKDDIIKSLSNIYQTLVEIAKIKKNWNILYIFTSDGFGLEPIIFKLFKNTQMSCQKIFIHNNIGIPDHDRETRKNVVEVFENNKSLQEEVIIYQNIKDCEISFNSDSLIITCQRADYTGSSQLLKFIADTLSNSTHSCSIIDILKRRYRDYYVHFFYKNILEQTQDLKILVNHMYYTPSMLRQSLNNNYPNIPQFLLNLTDLLMSYKYNEEKNTFSYKEINVHRTLKNLFEQLTNIGNMLNIAMHFNTIMAYNLQHMPHDNTTTKKYQLDHEEIFNNIIHMQELFRKKVGLMINFAFTNDNYNEFLKYHKNPKTIPKEFTNKKVSLANSSDMEQKYNQSERKPTWEKFS